MKESESERKMKGYKKRKDTRMKKKKRRVPQTSLAPMKRVINFHWCWDGKGSEREKKVHKKERKKERKGERWEGAGKKLFKFCNLL